MATQAALAKRRSDAMNQLDEAARILAERFGVEMPTIRRRSRDPVVLHVTHLVELASFVAALAKATEPKPKRRAKAERAE